MNDQTKRGPEISVILPVHNGEAYLKETIDSILSQTYTNFELIVINDGSTDSSEQIILSYTDSRIVYLKNETNLKLIATLNRGIQAAKGKYIARMDADDRCHPTRFAKQVKLLESNREIGVCGSWARLIDGQGNRIGRIKNACSPGLLRCLLFFTCPLLHPSVMGKACVFKDNAYDPEMLHIEDMELWNRLSGKGILFANIPEFLIDYRWHSSNISVLNDTLQSESKLRLLQPQVSELLGGEVTKEEMELHLFSFNLYSKGRKCADNNLSARLPEEKEWLIKLSSANKARKLFPETDFNALILSRWIVCCIAFGAYAEIMRLPLNFYNPAVIAKAALLLLQK